MDISRLDLCGLRGRFQEVYGSKAPVHMSRQVLIQAVAYQIQCNAFGGFSDCCKRALSSGKIKDGTNKRPRKISRRYKRGTQFLRHWQGRTHVVTVNEDGAFEYQRTAYGSLSKVARAITGTRWSGPAFFGLTGNEEKAHG